MSNDPYQAPHAGQGKFDSGEPNQTGLFLGIASIATGVLAVFPGCCCILAGGPLGLIAVGTGVFGIVNADERVPMGKILSIIGVVLGALALLWIVVALVLNATGMVDPNQFQQFQNR